MLDGVRTIALYCHFYGNYLNSKKYYIYHFFSIRLERQYTNSSRFFRIGSDVIHMAVLSKNIKGKLLLGFIYLLNVSEVLSFYLSFVR